MELNTSMCVDLDEVRKFVESSKFSKFLLDNTTDFSVAAYVLQSLLNCIENDSKEIDNGQ